MRLSRASRARKCRCLTPPISRSWRCLRWPKWSRRPKRFVTGSAMPTNILMPALSPTMEKGNLARWLKKEGDKIKSGDIIAEIETDKATMEYEAVDEGTLAKIVVPEGTQDVAVNAVIAVLAAEGEDVKAAASGVAKSVPAKPASAPAPSPQPSPPRGEGAGSAAPRAQSPSPLPSGE